MVFSLFQYYQRLIITILNFNPDLPWWGEIWNLNLPVFVPDKKHGGSTSPQQDFFFIVLMFWIRYFTPFTAIVLILTVSRFLMPWMAEMHPDTCEATASRGIILSAENTRVAPIATLRSLDGRTEMFPMARETSRQFGINASILPAEPKEDWSCDLTSLTVRLTGPEVFKVRITWTE